nr:PREDICTED: uncharacterized protein LOC109039342 [Bemisia tabaci]
MAREKIESNHLWLSMACILVVLAQRNSTHPTSESEHTEGGLPLSSPPTPSFEGNSRDSRRFSVSIFREIAQEISARLAGNSQILSLNVTNIIIILILKGILYGAALIGTGALFGGFKHLQPHRSDVSGNQIREGLDPDEPVISESEVLMLLGYLMGETANKYDCLNRIACQDPKKATEYIHAAKMLLKGSNIFYKNNVPQYAKYQRVLDELQRAVDFGNSGGQCEELYSCSSSSNNYSNY